MHKEIQGWMSEGECKWLRETAKKMHSVVEIGSWKGKSTQALLQGCPGLVYAVDTWKGSKEELLGAHAEATTSDIFKIFLANVRDFSNLRVRQMQSHRAAKTIPNVDMVFIDGSHLYESVKRDIEVWLPKTLKLICGHDRQQDGVPKAVEEIFGETSFCENIWFKWLLKDGGLPKYEWL